MPIFNILLEFLLNPWFLISLIFWMIVSALAYLLKNKKDAAYLFFPLLAMFKTKKLNNFIKKISKKAPKFWKVFWTIGIFVSFGFIIYAFYFFFVNFINLYFNPRIEQAIIPLIPGVTIDLPIFFYLLLPLLFIITTHEFAHGIAASTDGVDIKSTGVLGAGLFFLVGFGAFVEVDEREVNSIKYHRNTRLRIAAAGTYVNAITTGIAFILILCFPLMISPFYRNVTQVNTVLTPEEGGFNYSNLSNGDVILATKESNATDDNYISIDNYNGFTLDKILSNKSPLKVSVGDNLTFKIYNPAKDSFSEKNVTLGPRYNIGIRYKYISDGNAIKIIDILSESEGGNNYDKNLTSGLIINYINGTAINKTNGDTLEKYLTTLNLKALNLSNGLEFWIIDVEVKGVVIGIYTNSYFMYKNDLAKFFTSFFPEFVLREILWLFIIAFSVTLFNMLPLPVFDGDRIIKELINWGIGEDYKDKRKRSEIFPFKKDDREYSFSEYRIERIESIKLKMKNSINRTEGSEILLAEDKYNLEDKIDDGFFDTVILNIPENAKIQEDSVVEITYEYWYDQKKPIKKGILNTIRLITLFIVIGNFLLSFLKFGAFTFWF